MPSEKPEYRVYRARPGLLSRLLNRREGQRFRPLERRHQPPGPGAPAARPGTATIEPPPAKPIPPRLPGDLPGEPWWRRLTWKRVLLGVAGFAVFWTLLSFVLFM